MAIDLDRAFELSVTSAQLVLFAVLASLAVYKMVLSQKNSAKFLLLFYLFALLDSLVYTAMMVYQIVKLGLDE